MDKKFKPSSKSIYHSILFLVGRHLKIFTNSGIFLRNYFFQHNYKYINLFAGEVSNAWKEAYFLYVSAICIYNYLALFNTTQWWFRWQKMAPDWLWGGLVHPDIFTLLNIGAPGPWTTFEGPALIWEPMRGLKP